MVNEVEEKWRKGGGKEVLRKFGKQRREKSEENYGRSWKGGIEVENERVQKAEKRRGKKVGQVERRRRIKS